MDFAIVLLIAAVVFGLCFVLDKVYTKVFRNKKQHKSGNEVRHSKRYGSFGLIIAVLGLAAILTGLPDNWLLFCGGIVVLLVGTGLVVFYMTFGIFYDEDSFVLTTFGKKSKSYRYEQIVSQQLFTSYNNLVVELLMDDGRTVQLQSVMKGLYPFLDKASAGWMVQKGMTAEACEFYDPENSCWFPTREE